MMLSQEQARLICEANNIFDILDDGEESWELEKHNPELFEAYCEIHKIAAGVYKQVPNDGPVNGQKG